MLHRTQAESDHVLASKSILAMHHTPLKAAIVQSMGPAIFNQAMLSVGQKLGSGWRIASTMTLRCVRRSMQEAFAFFCLLFAGGRMFMQLHRKRIAKSAHTVVPLGEANAAKKTIGRWR